MCLSRLSTALHPMGQGVEEPESGSYSQFNLMVLIFPAFYIQLFGVHPNCITWVYFTCLKMFLLVYIGPKPSLLLPYHRGSPFLKMGFQLGGADKYTPFLDTAFSLPLLLRMSACCTSPDLLLSQCPLPSVFTFHCI